MRRMQERRIRRDELNAELYLMLLALTGTLQGVMVSLLLLSAERQMKGVNNYGNR